MRKVPRQPVLFSSDEESTSSFVTEGFYKVHAAKKVYLNPLERKQVRANGAAVRIEFGLQYDSNVQPPIKAETKPESKPKKAQVKPHRRRNKKEKTPPISLRSSPRKKKNPTTNTTSSMYTLKNSPQFAKRGIKLYVQNWKKQQNKGTKRLKIHAKKLKKQPTKRASKNCDISPVQLSPKASRGLDFGQPEHILPLHCNLDEDGSPEVKVMDDSTDTQLDNVVSTDETSLPSGNRSIVKPAIKRHLETAKQSTRKRSRLAFTMKHSQNVDVPIKHAQRKQKMKTGEESLNVLRECEEEVGAKNTTEVPDQVEGDTAQKFEDWLWSPGKICDDVETTDTIWNIVSQCLDTPDSSSKGSVASPSKSLSSAPSLYPVFTPPTSPSFGVVLTPSHRRRGKTLHTPKTKKLGTPDKNSPLTSKSHSAWTKLKDKDGLEQMVLDLGQKYFGAVTCDVCGMVYTATHPEDEANHAKHHRKYLNCTKFNGWKKEEVAEEFPDGRIIIIEPDAPKYAHRKVEEIRELVDRQLGFVEVNTLAGKDRCKTFLFITSEKKIGGCLISEGISKGYRVIPDEEVPESKSSNSSTGDSGSMDPSSQESQKAWCCQTVQEPAICGVSRIWVATQMRRKHIATRLMEALRNHYSFGSILTMDDIAFSDPTPDGKLFAMAYTKTQKFLVYKYN